MMTAKALERFAEKYTVAWCSQDTASVAAFFAPDGSLTINDGGSSIGRAAITSAVQGIMKAFPDLMVLMDRLVIGDTRSTYHWILVGTNTGPGGTGRTIRISGFEEWRMSVGGLIAESKGHFDEGEYQSQLNAVGLK